MFMLLRTLYSETVALTALMCATAGLEKDSDATVC